ncbi:MAG: ATP-binding protein [Bacteroidota bacterium]
MERELLKSLFQWKNRADRKPLIIRGARQVGKTWLLKEFGKTYYKNIAYINFETAKSLHSIFESGFEVDKLIMALKIETDTEIIAGETLIILDEIQECEAALTSLKYFHENANQYHIAAAGSLLGVSLHKNRSFPVGKVDFLDLHPLHFLEFLEAMNELPLLDLLQRKNWDLITGFKAKYIHLLKQYYYVGGMPEAVLTFINQKDFKKVREKQLGILAAYEQDFSKYAPHDIVPRIRLVWQSLPSQLAKENRKFIYGNLKNGARAREFELAIEWLTDAGLVHKVSRCNKPAMPLIAYAALSDFKLYLLDVGLLAAMGNIDIQTFITEQSLFEEFKGALAEQYVLQQFKSLKQLPIYYWTAERATAEVDFLIQYQHRIIPVEVKAAENLKAKSLKVYHQKFNPEISIRTSLADYRKEDWLINLPLYACTAFIDENGL